jgi:hypothetical protein
MLYWGKDRQCFAADWQSDGDKQNTFSVFSFDPKLIAAKRTLNQTESAGAVSLKRAAKTAQETHRKGCGIFWKAADPFWRERVWGDERVAVNDDRILISSGEKSVRGRS